MRNLNTPEINVISGGFDEGQPPCVPPPTKPSLPADPGVAQPAPAQVVYVGNDTPLRAAMTEYLSPDDIWQPLP